MRHCLAKRNLLSYRYRVEIDAAMFCKVEKNPRQRAEKESVLFGKVELETISRFLGLGRSEKSCGASLKGTVET